MKSLSSPPARRNLIIKGSAAALMVALIVPGLFGACQVADEEPCPNDSTIVSESGARLVLTVPLPFEPGPMAVVTPAPSGGDVEVSRSSRLWLGEGGLGLYALAGAGVWRVDLATLETSRVGGVDREAGQLTGGENEDTLLVTDPVQGTLWVLDQLGPARPVRIPLGGAPSAVAFGPGHRLAYVTNPGDQSLALVDTGVGMPSPVDRVVLVAAAAEGTLLRLDGDGRLQTRYEGLPSRLNDLAVLPGGRQVVASYVELVTTGDPGITGDGLLVLHEGLCLLDLETGAVEPLPLPRPAGTAREGSLAWPAGVVPLGEGTVAVALPGWGVVAVVDVGPASPRRGEVLREIPVPGRPCHLARATLELDWLYVLDESGDQLSVLSTKGTVSGRITLQ